MFQISTRSQIWLAVQPVDFRKGIDGLVALCRQHLQQDPYSGHLFIFCNRSKTALKLLIFDGQGVWLCLKRWRGGKLKWWPQQSAPLHPLALHELQTLLFNGSPPQTPLSWQSPSFRGEEGTRASW